MARLKIDTAAIRRLALTVNVSQLAAELGVTRNTMYRYLDGGQSNFPEVAQRVALNLRRLRQRFELPEIVAAGLNNRANARLSVRSSARGPFTKVEVLRYPLGQIDQRYDASENTLLVRRWVLHDILRKSTLVNTERDARASLLATNLITRVTPDPNLAYGIAMPHRTIDCYTIDLTRIEWSTLNTLCQISATRSDPCQSGIVHTQSKRAINAGIIAPSDGLRSSLVPTLPR